MEIPMKTLCTLVAFAALGQAQMNKASYQPSEENFPNPERGFYYQATYQVRGGKASPPLEAAGLAKWRDSGVTLIRGYYVITEFRDAPLSPAMLERIRADFAALRQAGMKVIPRFTYNFGPPGVPDASVERVLGHLDQLAPLFKANEDVIAFLESGFIGAWGEWHASINNLLGTSAGIRFANDNTRAIVKKLLESLPPGRMIALRYPRHKMEIFGPEPLTESEAFGGTPKARTGAYNDCFLASANDVGTYSNDMEREKQFYRQDNLFVPQGGETCGIRPDVRERVACPTALRELEQLHFTTLNSGYNRQVLDGWRQGGCMAEVERRLGYRFRLVDSEASTAAAAARELRVNFTVANDGFANMYNQRPVEIVLRPKAGGKVVRLATKEDPRRWMTGRTTAVRISAPLPKGIKPGEYDVFLALPDLADSLRSRPEYAVRFANAGVWDAATGMNRLAHVVKIRR
jgi:hypothetical protein